MLLTIRYQNGLRSEAVLLAATRHRMRVAVASRRDTIELRKANACWFTEEGAEVEIEAFIPLAGIDVPGFCTDVYPRTLAAGSGFTPA